jgi:CHAD domain
VHRILLGHVERSLGHMSRGRLASDRAIHGARKELKRARAALRLLRPGLARTVYHSEDAALRRAARPLGAVRDTKALLDRCDDLARRACCAQPCELRRRLRAEHARARRELLFRAAALGTQRAALREFVRRSERWRIEQARGSVIRAGIERTYSRGRRALELARTERSTVRLHEVRKRAQYLWHQLKLLEPLAPRSIGKRSREAHRVSELLGEDHDLALLARKARARTRSPRIDRSSPAAHMHGRPVRLSAARERDAFLQAIEARREVLEQRAFDVAERLYRDRPRAFAREASGG